MIRKNNPLAPGAILLGLLLLGGCSNLAPSHLIFHQSLVFGADISTASETGAMPDRLNVVVGYDRHTNAIIPKTRVCSDKNSSGEIITRPCAEDEPLESTQFEAMSVISKSYIGMNWFGTDKISERLATGDAAIEMAKSPELIEALNLTDK